ncbi:MAG: protein-glutamate O-methyltransferase CheR [Magnetococcales bacterium]|nr:protein-glutamate O-methyltransferase CheR [Magnetococcales bacterium]
MSDPSLHAIEIHLLLEALRLRHGYDFSQYTRASLERRLLALTETLGCASLLELLPRILQEEAFVTEIIAHLSVPVTEMFREPATCLALRDRVFPYLATYPRIQIWLAGCASGEEAYSLAILLQEEGLLEQTTLFATDINDPALNQAETGSLPLDRLQHASRKYRLSGGKGSLLDHFHLQDQVATLHPDLMHKIVFAHHNLVTDRVFAETHLVYCTNVLIYFNAILRKRVLDLFRESLVRGGFLTLGAQESLAGSDVESHFREIDPGCRIYRLHPPKPASSLLPPLVPAS